ncbi:PAAR-like protein [Zobellia laminariae]|uniref:PAAR-like protein n=1 Tax=Zobellia laminariae TaxID=248906 RepID=UPI003F65AAEC
MANKKYVPQGTYLACDKGTVPVEFMITNNNNSFLFEEPIANSGDMVPMVNVMPMGVCTVTSNPCVPAPIMWDGFEDGIFIGFFNPLLEDSVLPCGAGGKIEIFYSMEDATAACAEEESSFWGTLGKVVLVVAAVALIVVTGGAALAAIAAVGAATGALATGVAVTVAALEVAGCLLTVKALYDYSQDGDEEALFKEVALGFLFLGAGKALEKGFRMWKAGSAVKASDELLEIGDDALKGADEIAGMSKEALEQALKTEPDTAFFWSGRTNGVGGQDVALDIAKSRGGTTMEGIMDANNVKMPDWDIAKPESIKAWEDASAMYAKGVSGEVRAVVGNKLRPNNIWENVELPRLMKNPDVTKITTIDPVTQIEKVIFTR